MKKRLIILLVLTLLVLPSFSSAVTIAELQVQLQVLMAQLTALQSQTQTTTAPPAGGAASDSCPNLTRNLSRGSRDTDVTKLQQFLISQNLLASDSATGFFGAMTERAVQRFQSGRGIVSHGTPNSTGYGVVGRLTRSAIVNTCNQKPVVVPTNPTCPLVGYGIDCLTGTHKVRQYDANGCETMPQCATDQTPPVSVNPTPSPVSCTPLSPQTQTLSCPSGQTGSIMQTRTSSCATGATSPTWSSWSTTANTCQSSYHTGGTITVSSPTLVIPHADIDRVASSFGGWLDAPLATVQLGGAQYWLKSDSFKMAKVQGTLEAPFGTIVWNKTTSDVFSVLPVLPVADGTRRGYWIVNTYQAPDGILAFVHIEHPRNPTPTTYDTGKTRIGLAWSSDGGDHFTYLGDILSPYTDPATSNIQGSPYIVKDGYFYTYFTDDACVGWESGNAVARAPVADVLSAARQGQVTQWNKYYNGGWQSAGLGGNCSSIGAPGITHSDAAFSTYTGKYYLITSRMNWGGQDTWLKLYESSDGVTWTLKKTIVQEPASAVQRGYQYTSIVNTAGSDNGIVGKTFYIYGEKEAETNRAAVFRWPVDLDGNGANNSTIAVIPASQTDVYSASSGFSQTQGLNNWSYLDSSGATMTFDTASNWWRGSEQYALLFGSGGHPGMNVDAIRRWTAPRAGTTHITGSASDGDAGGGDGVVVSIRKGPQTLWSQSIVNGGASVSYDVTTTVQSGNTIDFVINKGTGDNSYDSTSFDPHIMLQ